MNGIKTAIDNAYLRLLQAVRDNPKPFSKHESKRLVAHYPMRGLADKVDIMFIGRALNNWTNDFPVPKSDDDLNALLRQIKGNVGKKDKVHPEREQLRWVDDRNHKHKDYNSKLSQFWQTIREVMYKRGAEKGEWWHGIVWSNFYKLSHPKGNPSAGMKNFIGQPSMNLLLAEISEFKPRYIVCLSGMEYAADLLARCEVTRRVVGIEKTHYIEYSGLVTLAGEQNVGLVIFPHPQGKGRIRRLMVEEITEQLTKLEALKK